MCFLLRMKRPNRICSKDKWFSFLFLLSLLNRTVTMETETYCKSFTENGKSFINMLFDFQREKKIISWHFMNLFKEFKSNESVIPFPNRDFFMYAWNIWVFFSLSLALSYSIEINSHWRTTTDENLIYHHFTVWAQVSNHWIGKCTSIDKKWLQKAYT